MALLEIDVGESEAEVKQRNLVTAHHTMMEFDMGLYILCTHIYINDNDVSDDDNDGSDDDDDGDNYDEKKG